MNPFRSGRMLVRTTNAVARTRGAGAGAWGIGEGMPASSHPTRTSRAITAHPFRDCAISRFRDLFRWLSIAQWLEWRAISRVRGLNRFQLEIAKSRNREIAKWVGGWEISLWPR